MKTHKTITSLMLTALVLAAAAGAAAEPQGTVNINSAGAEQLSLLPRVGSVVAQRIIDFREQNGNFKTAEDLMLVKGIGEKTFELIRPYVSLSGETTLAEKVSPPRKASEDKK
jgi:competence protein ComEA